MRQYQPIQQIHSSAFDKVSKSLTLVFLLATIAIAIATSIFQTYIDAYSNASDYIDESSVFGYIAHNLNSTPIKQIYFRDLYCDTSEEQAQLFNYGSVNLTYWNSQMICVQRYRNIRMGSNCDAQTEYQCGPYCIQSSEGTQCPISKITITENDTPDIDADQNLENKRDMYLSRENGSYGIYQLQAVALGYPCVNPRYVLTAGVNQTHDYTSCDSMGEDTENTVRIETTTMQQFITTSVAAQKLEMPPKYTESALVYLVSRLIINTRSSDECTQIQYTQIDDVAMYAEDIEEIGFIYLILKSLFSGMIVIVLIVEMIILKGKLVNDVRIITVLLKVLLMVLMSLLLIEGGLELYSDSQRASVELYFHSKVDCYTSSIIMRAFEYFPNLFSNDVLTFLEVQTICMIVIGSMEGIVGCIYIVQMFHWCLRERVQINRPKQIIEDRQQVMSQHTDPYNQISPKSIVQPGQQINFIESYVPPQSDMVAQVVLSRKNNKNSKY